MSESTKMMWVGLAILGAALCWGVYVPTVHKATSLLQSNLRAFLFVGVAYFLVAIIVPSLFIFVLGDPTAGKSPNFGQWAMIWGIAAGVFGALGALCVIFAAKTAGPGGALYVAPLVFAGAPIINTFVTLYYFDPAGRRPDFPFYLGLILAAAGAFLVVVYKPKGTHGAPAKPVAAATLQAEPAAVEKH